MEVAKVTVFVWLALFCGRSAIAEEIIVNTLTDIADGDFESLQRLRLQPGLDQSVSLREAIHASNGSIGSHVIRFSQRGTIELTTALPRVRGDVIIDGEGAIRISGLNLESWNHVSMEFIGDNGIEIDGSNTVIRGLTIVRMPGHGILIQGSDSSYNIIEGCRIGSDGVVPLENFGHGIHIESGRLNTIGGITAETRNVISGNMGGIAISEGEHNRVLGNYIGLDESGTYALPNFRYWIRDVHHRRITSFGVQVIGRWNLIGGNGWGEGNLISANHAVAIQLAGAHSQYNTVQGNKFVGDATPGSMVDERDRYYAINIDDAPNNLIGGPEAAMGNDLSGYCWFASSAVRIVDPYATGNKVQGNIYRIESEAHEEGNSAFVVTSGASANLIGGIKPGEGNIIHGGRRHGVLAQPYNAVRGNSITGNVGKPISMNSAWLNELDPPLLVTTAPPSGTAHPCSEVDLFADRGDEGEIYLGSTRSDGCGFFQLLIATEQYAGWNMTATVTTGKGFTSEFSAAYPITGSHNVSEEAPNACECLPLPHTGDYNNDWRVDMAEMLFGISLYNNGHFSCDGVASEYYVASDRLNWYNVFRSTGSLGSMFCVPHDLDFAPQDWQVSLSELLRLIQLYNGNGYTAVEVGEQTEDGFRPL